MTASSHAREVDDRHQAEAPRHDPRARPAARSARPTTCPTVPRSAGCSPGSRTSFVWRRSMKLHDLKPAPGSTRAQRRVGRGIGGKGGKTAGRGSKGQGARNTVSPRFEGGQTPLHRRTPKSKGFTNPFRVEYHVVNLDTLEALRRRRRGHPRHPAGAGPRRQARPGQGARTGRAHQGAHRPRARVLGRGGARDRGRRRHHPRDPGSLG